MNVIGDRLKQAREAKGLTQTKLAELVGVSQGAISSFESGRISPSSGNVESIALATGFPMAFFRKRRNVEIPLGSLLYRSRANVKATSRDQAHVWAGLMAELAVDMAQRLSLPPVLLPHIPGSDPVDGAQITRSELGLPPDSPIPNLVRVLERAGLISLVLPYACDGIEAFCFWLAPPSGPRRPFIVSSPQRAGDRLRMSIAHEVAHLALHFPLGGSISAAEKDAYAFASELLTPASAMRREIPVPVTLSTLTPLKPRWGVSIQMLVKRSHDLGLTTDNQNRSLFRQIAAHGWKKQEPENLVVPVERPRALRKMAEVLAGMPHDNQQVTNLARDEAMPSSLISAFLAGYETAGGEPSHKASAQGEIVEFSSRLIRRDGRNAH